MKMSMFLISLALLNAFFCWYEHATDSFLSTAGNGFLAGLCLGAGLTRLAALR